jgi:hypothetical protein
VDAIGGQLAYRYGRDGHLAGLDMATAQSVLADSNFNIAPQVAGAGATSAGVRLMRVSATEPMAAGTPTNAANLPLASAEQAAPTAEYQVRIAPPRGRALAFDAIYGKIGANGQVVVDARKVPASSVLITERAVSEIQVHASPRSRSDSALGVDQLGEHARVMPIIGPVGEAGDIVMGDETSAKREAPVPASGHLDHAVRLPFAGWRAEGDTGSAMAPYAGLWKQAQVRVPLLTRDVVDDAMTAAGVFAGTDARPPGSVPRKSVESGLLENTAVRDLIAHNDRQRHFQQWASVDKLNAGAAGNAADTLGGEASEAVPVRLHAEHGAVGVSTPRRLRQAHFVC